MRWHKAVIDRVTSPVNSSHDSDIESGVYDIDMSRKGEDTGDWQIDPDTGAWINTRTGDTFEGKDGGKTDGKDGKNVKPKPG